LFKNLGKCINPMGIFQGEPGKLEELIAASPEVYNNGIIFLENVKGRGALSKEVEEGLEADIAFLKAANDRARNSDYFIFSVYDSWAERTGCRGMGYEVYQKVNNKLIVELGLDTDGPADFEETVKFLKEKKVTKAYTLDIPLEGYCGLKEETDGGDGDVITSEIVEERDIKAFKEERIIVLPLES
jgi:hypothetical protein